MLHGQTPLQGSEMRARAATEDLRVFIFVYLTAEVAERGIAPRAVHEIAPVAVGDDLAATGAADRATGVHECPDVLLFVFRGTYPARMVVAVAHGAGVHIANGAFPSLDVGVAGADKGSALDVSAVDARPARETVLL